jgi:hypothetical protein
MNNKDIAPLLISILMILISLAMIFTSDYAFDQTHYIGIGCLVFSTLLYFINKKFYIYVFALTLIGGLIGLLDFFYMSFKIGFSGVGVNPIFIILLILFFVFSRDTMNKLFPEKSKKE